MTCALYYGFLDIRLFHFLSRVIKKKPKNSTKLETILKNEYVYRVPMNIKLKHLIEFL